MQRTEPEGIVISCDFCLTDWDEVKPMIEGHQGSILCLDCLKKGLAESQPSDTDFDCTLCLQTHEAGKRVWQKNNAALCWNCTRLACKGFHKDPDTDFRWNPADHPPGE